ncbi:QsdR family transcriptional regulator [Gordonia sp. NPDC003376]
MSAVRDHRERVHREDVLRLARSKYLSGERIDLNQIAQEAGVSRVTLHRWVGTRDALLVEVIWPLTAVTLEQEWQKAQDLPGARVPRVIGGYLRAVMAQPGARRFLVEENERAMKIFTLAAHGFQPRFVAAIRDLLALDVESGRTSTILSLDELAYATVRIAESYHYLPTIAGEEADPETAERVLTAFLDTGRPETAAIDA